MIDNGRAGRGTYGLTIVQLGSRRLYMPMQCPRRDWTEAAQDHLSAFVVREARFMIAVLEAQTGSVPQSLQTEVLCWHTPCEHRMPLRAGFAAWLRTLSQVSRDPALAPVDESRGSHVYMTDASTVRWGCEPIRNRWDVTGMHLAVVAARLLHY